ncbi:MAG: alpha/beta hydrolase [Candidatus Obscuribacterales bacterium]|jgi:acetyl esterase/lipase|nr:alpha/beta hydrolase [Candidatus Obscuribacterales bacterium]
MMKMRTRLLVGFVAAITLSVVLIGVWRAWSKADPPKFVVMKDLPYVPGTLDPFQYLDLYLPSAPSLPTLALKGSAPATLPANPVIVWVHGGAWMAGDKNHPEAVGSMIKRGYAVASINYRLTNRFTHPAQINDCKAAVRYLRANAQKYGLDPNRIGVWGTSAGGHLAALLGTSGDVKELEGDLGNNEFSSRVQAVVDWCGPTDLVSIAAQAKPNSKIDFRAPGNPVHALMGTTAAPASYLAASPVQYVSKDDPPILVIHAKDDDVVPFEQSVEFIDLLKKIGVEVEGVIPSGGGHALSSKRYVEQSLDFFDKHLGAKK